ncbi:hypothetical protein WT26_28535 [Burkholderia cepacia]|uniref:Uncharacterized protein n=1 Tax=Burkholderia cepacia TaxID=292 RepID=A0A1B4Q0X0_BURCE|nr:hypothetical protein WT26_28535 [Burkholderia cepacia]
MLSGTMKTPAWEARVQRNPQVFEQLRKWYPLDDFATPDDVAQAALFLCSPAAPRRRRGSSRASRCPSTAACWPAIA